MATSSEMVGAVKVEKTKAMKLAYIEHVGDYGAIPFAQYVERLYGWAKKAKVMPGFYPMGIFHGSPDTTPPDRCRSEIAISVVGDAKPSEGIKIGELPAMQVATISHRGPTADYPKTYGQLSAYIAEKGYEWAGPSIEVYSKKPQKVGGKTIVFAKIKAPIRKK